jgi:hypothetical protein
MSVPEDPRSHGRGTPSEEAGPAERGEAALAGPQAQPDDGVDAPEDRDRATGMDEPAEGDVASRPTVRLPYQRRVVPPQPQPRGPRLPPLPVAALVNAVWAAILTFVPVLAITAAVTQIGSARPAFADTLRYALAACLLGYGVPLRLADFPIAVVPLLVTVFAWWRIVRAGRHTVRALKARGRGSWRITGGTCVAIAVPYALMGLCAALIAGGGGITVSPLRATLQLALFAALGGGLGAGAATGATRRFWWRVPPLVRDGVRAGAVGALLLLSAGGLAAGVAVAAAGGDAADVLHRYHTGVVGQATLVLICLVYAPNIALWATAFLAGPGFTLAAAPALPVFAGLPDRPLTGLAQLVLAVPVLAGACAGLLVMRKRGVRPRVLAAWPMAMLVAAEAGVASGVSLSLAGLAASGSLGVGLLSDMGQVGWQFPVIAGLGIGFGAFIGLSLDRTRRT